VEVLLPLGAKEMPTWMAFDPTHHCRCDERYITVAVGRDYQDVAPTSGHYSGESSNELQTTVAVIVESQGVGEYWQSPQMMLQETSPPDQGQEQ
jgi:transglutaminase-like putative cysteine protease